MRKLSKKLTPATKYCEDISNRTQKLLHEINPIYIRSLERSGMFVLTDPVMSKQGRKQKHRKSFFTLILNFALIFAVKLNVQTVKP